MHQHHPRHVDVLMKDLGLEHGNSVQPPALHGVTDDEPEPLDRTQSSNYRSEVARCLFFSHNRPHRTFIVHELCQSMSNFTHRSLAKLRSQTLEARKAVRTHCQLWNMGEEVMTYSDPDWAGCKETQVLKLLRDMARQSHVESILTQTEHHCKEQRGVRIGRSNIQEASEPKRIVSLLCHVGYVLKPVLVIDEKGHRTHSPPTRSRSIETHRCGSIVDSR